MTTLNQNIQTGPMNMDQISGINPKNERGIEMLKTEKQNWFSRNLGNIVPVKLLVGLAVGAMLMTAIGMPGNGVSADEPSRPLVLAYQGFGSLADVVTYAKVERQGLGSIDDWANSGKVTHQGFDSLATIPTTYAKVERQGFGSIDDWANSGKVTHQGFGSLATIPTTNAKVERRGFGSLADVVTHAKVERQNLGSIDDLANVTPRGFGSLDDIGAVRR